MKKIAVVYQAGIANVFEVATYTNDLVARQAKRLLQAAFSPCEWYARGMADCGAEVHSYACNWAGDVIGRKWTPIDDPNADNPFRDQQHPVHHQDRFDGWK